MCSRHSFPVLLALLVVVAGGLGLDRGAVRAIALDAQAPAAAPPVALPNRDGSFKFAVLGDFGNATRAQYQLAGQMATLQGRFKYGTVVTVGDNLYGGERPQDFKEKFEIPYKALLDAGVKFYASLGNHDAREQRQYKLFNMGGELFYTFTPHADVRFFVLETTYPTPEQFTWLEKELKSSNHKWKIPVFHHPLYSSGNRHGSDIRLREVLEPLFVTYDVSVVLTGHDHFYERVKPQKGITYFVAGSGGQLRPGNIDSRSAITAQGFDSDLVFLAAEIVGDEMYFNAISRTGQIVDSGVLKRRTSIQRSGAGQAASGPAPR